MKKLLSVIVPCFNEEEVIALFYHEIIKYLQQLPVDYELVFVNDGSRDRTVEEVMKLHEFDSRVALINFSRNFGKEAAMYAGLNYCKGDYVVFIDSDLQHPPVLLKEMLRLIQEEGYETVGTFRLARGKKGRSESLIRILYSKLFYRFINRMSNVRIKENATDYRMMTRKVVNALLKLTEYNRFSKGLFEWIGFKTKYIGYENVERAAGKSSWSFFKLFNYAIEGITSFSIIPLKLSSLLGLVSAFASFIYMAYVIFDRIAHGTDVSGWATTVSLILFIGGILLISLGLLGEYIGRIYNEVKNRPIYIIDTVVESKHEDKAE